MAYTAYVSMRTLCYFQMTPKGVSMQDSTLIVDITNNRRAPPFILTHTENAGLD